MEKLGFDWLVIVVYVINFGILFFLLQKVAYQPILGMLEKRKQAIKDGLEAAEKVKKEAEAEKANLHNEIELQRQKFEQEANEIKKQNAGLREKILAEARQEAAGIIEKARKDMAEERHGLKSKIAKEVANLTMQLTRKVIGQSIDEKRHRQLVHQFLAKVGD